MDAARALWKDEKLKPTALLWLYDEDAQEWRFLVATQEVRKRGPQAAYLRIRGILKKASLLEKLPLRRVVLSDPSNPLLETIGQFVRTPDDALASTSFCDCTFNSLNVAGIHIYLLQADNVTTVQSPLSAPAAEAARP
jgi:hypothetical protein